MATYPIKELTTDKMPEARAGMRNVRLGWKTTKNVKALSSTKYVQVAKLSVVAGSDQKISDWIHELVYDAQDRYIHQLVSDRIRNGEQYSLLTNDDIDIEAMAKEAVVVRSGSSKITKEMIKEWFTEQLAPMLAEYVLEQVGQDAVKAEKVLGNYLELYQRFASPVYMAQVPLAKKLLEMLAAYSENDQNRVYKYLGKKLIDQSTEKTIEDFGI